jgi:predicted RNA-binding Zn-ribbon protein involved in translation (DUF1610 family)
MPTISSTPALYVYRCNACGHAGELRLLEQQEEITSACTSCGAEVVAEWDGGVELTQAE